MWVGEGNCLLVEKKKYISICHLLKFLPSLLSLALKVQSNLNSWNTDGLFIMANSNNFESLLNSSDSSIKHIFRKPFLF